MDTCGGFTFLFRNKEFSEKLNVKYIPEQSLFYFPDNVILFIGNDYWKNKIP